MISLNTTSHKEPRLKVHCIMDIQTNNSCPVHYSETHNLILWQPESRFSLFWNWFWVIEDLVLQYLMVVIFLWLRVSKWLTPLWVTGLSRAGPAAWAGLHTRADCSPSSFPGPGQLSDEILVSREGLVIFDSSYFCLPTFTCFGGAMASASPVMRLSWPEKWHLKMTSDESLIFSPNN